MCEGNNCKKDVCKCAIEEAKAEAAMLTAINIIAANHNCVVDNIDFDNKVINLTGNKENEVNCALSISRYIEESGGKLL